MATPAERQIANLKRVFASHPPELKCDTCWPDGRDEHPPDVLTCAGWMTPVGFVKIVCPQSEAAAPFDVLFRCAPYLRDWATCDSLLAKLFLQWFRKEYTNHRTQGSAWLL